MMIPVAAAVVAVLFIYWPKDGNFTRLVGMFNPAGMVDIGRMVNSGPFCSGPSYPDGKCPGAKGAPVEKEGGPAATQAPGQATSQTAGTFGRTNGMVDQAAIANGPLEGPSTLIPLLLLTLVVIGIARPKLLRAIFGRAEPKQMVPRETAFDDIKLPNTFERPRDFRPSPAVREFGRRRS